MMLPLLLTVALAAPVDYYRIAWPAVDGCINVREELLVRRGQAVLDNAGCTVLGGVFPDDWSRDAFAGSWSDVDVEHLIATRTLWDRFVEHNGRAPTHEEWVRIFTLPLNLWITRASTNRSRQDRGPHEWCPASATARRRAAAAWRFVLFQLDLPVSEDEERGLRAWESGRCLL